jgi:hypothetical protein
MRRTTSHCIILLTSADFRPRLPLRCLRLEHSAAGIVFAAVAAELLPEIRESGSPLTVAVGFTLGVICLLSVKLLSEGFEAWLAALFFAGFLLIIMLEMTG